MIPYVLSYSREFLSVCVLLNLLIVSSQAVAADYFVGKVEAQNKVVVSSEIDGVVSTRHVSLGEFVEKEQALSKLDDQDAKLSVALSRSRVRLSEAEYLGQQKTMKRLSTLVGRDVLSKSKLDDQERVLNTSRAQLEADRQVLEQSLRNLEKTNLTAPFSGVISERFVEKGQWVTAGTPMFELMNIATVRVRLLLLEDDYISLQVGDEVEVKIPSLNLVRKSRIIRVSPSLQNGQGYPVELELQNDGFRIKPGYRVEVSLPAEGE